MANMVNNQTAGSVGSVSNNRSIFQQPPPPPAPQQQHKRERSQPKQQTFLFVDSSEANGTEGAKQGRRNARSFVMQNARRQRPWSTSKQPGIRARASRASSATSSSGHVGPAPPPPSRTLPSSDLAGLSQNVSKKLLSSFGPNAHMQKELIHTGRNHCVVCNSISPLGQTLCESCVSASAAKASSGSPSSWVGARLDPFSSMPIQMDAQGESLTAHFFGAQMNRVLDIDFYHQSRSLRSALFGLSMNGAAGMRATLCASTIALLAVGKATMADVLNQKCQLISEINQALSDPLTGTCDSNIYAVSTLNTIEDALCDPRLQPESAQAAATIRHRKIHFNGMKRMIELRGGVKGLNASNRPFQMMLTWHAISHALLGCTEPYLDMNYWDSQVLYPHPPNFFYPQSHAQVSSMCHALEIHPDLRQSVQDASLSTVELEEWFHRLRLKSNPLEIQNRSVLISYRCFSWLMRTPKDRKRRPVEDCIAIAVHGFLTLVTINRERGFATEPGWMHARLKSNIQATESGDWMGCPVALFWTLCIGAMRSEGHAENEWFIVQLREACRLFSVNSLDAFSSQMSRVLWMPDRVEDLVPRLWERIQSHNTVEASPRQSEESPSKPEMKIFSNLQANPSPETVEAAHQGLLRSHRDSFRNFIFDEAEADNNKKYEDLDYHTAVATFLLPGHNHSQSHHNTPGREMVAPMPGSADISPTDVPPPLIPSGASDVSSPTSTDVDDPSRPGAMPDSAKYSNIDTALLDDEYSHRGSWGQGRDGLSIMQPDPFRHKVHGHHQHHSAQDMIPSGAKSTGQQHSATFIPRSHPNSAGDHRRAQSAVEFAAALPHVTTTPTSAHSEGPPDQPWMQSPVSMPQSAASDSISFVYPPPPQRQAPLLDADWLYRSYHGHH